MEKIFYFSENKRGIEPNYILDTLRRFARETSIKQRTAKEYGEHWRKKNSGPCLQTITKKFGSFANAMREAGAEYDPFASIRNSKEELDEELRRFLSETPVQNRTAGRYKAWRRRKFGSMEYTNFYESWLDAATKLGFEIPGRSKSKK